MFIELALLWAKTNVREPQARDACVAGVLGLKANENGPKKRKPGRALDPWGVTS